MTNEQKKFNNLLEQEIENEEKYKNLRSILGDKSLLEQKKFVDKVLYTTRLEYYKKYKLCLKYFDLFNKKSKEEKKLNKYKKKIILLSNLSKIIDNEQRMLDYKKKKKEINRKISDEQLIKLDYNLNIRTFDLFSYLYLEKSPSSKVEAINKIKKILNKKLKEFNLTKMSDEEIKEVVENIKVINILLKYLDKMHNRFNKIQKTNIKNELKQIDKTHNEVYYNLLEGKDVKNIKLTKVVLAFITIYEENKIDDNFINQLEIIKERLKTENIDRKNKYKIDEINEYIEVYKLIKNKDVSYKDLKLVIKVYNNMIRNNEIDDEFIEISKNILNRIEKEKINIKYIISILDTIKFRKTIELKDTENYKNLNKIKKMYNSYFEYLNSKYDEKEDDIECKFKIIYSLLYDTNNYDFIKLLLINCPIFINIRNNNKHIVCHILELYLTNLDKIINRKGKVDKNINVDYIKEVYYLFTRNNYIKLFDEDINNINSQIYKFLEKNEDYFNKNNEHLDLKEEIKKLSTYYYGKKNNVDLYEVNDERIISQSRYFEDLTKKEELDKEFIILSNPYVAYNYDEENEVLRICVPDLYSIIDRLSVADRYMHNKLMLHEDLDDRFLDRFKFKEGKKESVILFKIMLSPKVKNTFFISKRTITPKLKNNNNTMYLKLKKYAFSKMNKKDYNTSIDDIIYKITKRILNKEYIKFSEKNNVKYIYSGEEHNEEIISTDTYSKLSEYSINLDKQEYNNMYDVMTGNKGMFHYSDKKFDVNGDFDLSLIGTPNYLMYKVQEIISFYINNREIDENAVTELIDELNKNVGFTKPEMRKINTYKN